MSRRVLIAVSVVVFAGASPAATSRAHGALVFQSGTLHVAGDISFHGTISKPDLVMSSGAPVTHFGTVSYPPNPGPFGLTLVSYAGIDAALQDDHLSLKSELLAHNSEPSLPGVRVNAASAATITFLQTTPSLLELDLDITSDVDPNSSTPAGNGTVTVRDAANNLVMSFAASGSTATPSDPVTAFFAPGAYTVAFAHTDSAAFRFVDSVMLFDIVTAVPEPSAVALALLAAASATLGRSRRRPPA